MVQLSPATARSWLSLLEDSFLVRLVHPRHTNRTKRLIKSPKLYFLDAGPAAWGAALADGWLAASPVDLSFLDRP